MLKSVLALLLSKFVKRSDTEFICNQAFPDGWGRRILLKDAALGSFQDVYTAPSNGYFCIDAGNAIRHIGIYGAIHFRNEVPNVGLPWPQIFIVAAKGTSITYEVSALSGQTEGTDVYFVPAIGTPS